MIWMIKNLNYLRKYTVHLYSGRFRGGALPVRTPSKDQNFFNFMGFFRKCINILDQPPPNGLAPPPMTSPGSAPDLYYLLTNNTEIQMSVVKIAINGTFVLAIYVVLVKECRWCLQVKNPFLSENKFYSSKLQFLIWYMKYLWYSLEKTGNCMVHVSSTHRLPKIIGWHPPLWLVPPTSGGSRISQRRGR